MKPNKIFLIRHGQSEGNANYLVYYKKPDYAINLTQKGKEQSFVAGEKIKKIIGSQTCCIYTSPYYRTRQTTDEILKSIRADFVKEDPRLREVEYAAKFYNEERPGFEEEAKEYGLFYYRPEHGESCADVYDRISGFLDSLFRHFVYDNFPENVIICGHGMSHRILLMRLLGWTVEQFELLYNPKNCEIYTLIKNKTNQYELDTPLKRKEKLERSF